MLLRLLGAVLAMLLCASASAERKRIDGPSDLPRFSYRVEGRLDEMLRDDAKFRAFAGRVRRDVERIVEEYDIRDVVILRALLSELIELDLLEGRTEAARARLQRLQPVEDTPARNLLSGITARAVIAARAAADASPDARRAAAAASLRDDLASVRPAAVEDANALKSAEALNERSLLLRLQALQTSVERSGSLSSDQAARVIDIKYERDLLLPLRPALVFAWRSYVAARNAEKPDRWADRVADLTRNGGGSPVTIAIWDTGVDTELFEASRPGSGTPVPVIAFDRLGEPAQGALEAVPDALRLRLPELAPRLKGFGDVQANAETLEAAELHQHISTLTPDQARSLLEDLGRLSLWSHGTEMAAIAVAGNPFARLVVARVEANWRVIPDPCPTRELVQRDARNAQSIVEFFRKHDVRVVDMSWSTTAKDIETALELCGIGESQAARSAIARDFFDLRRNALRDAMAAAAEILFVASAGNSSEDPAIADGLPGSIALPNVLTVAAADRAGDQAAYTSYGASVKVHANGDAVESKLPGGLSLTVSGAAAAAAQVANLAGKVLAVQPRLTPPEVIALIRDHADVTSDSRRRLVNPRKTLAAARDPKRS